MKQVHLGQAQLSAPPNTAKLSFGVRSVSSRRPPIAPSHERPSKSWRLAACPFLHPSQNLQEPTKQAHLSVSGTDLWQRLTPCLFSKAASALRAAPWHVDASNTANTQRSLPALDAYVERVKALVTSIENTPGGLTTDGGLRAALAQQVPDMFAFEAPADHVGSGVADLARWTRDVLTTLCPESVETLKGLCADAHGHFADNGWHFTYRGVPFFVLVSSPAYGPQSSRYSGGHRQKKRPFAPAAAHYVQAQVRRFWAHAERGESDQSQALRDCEKALRWGGCDA